MRPNPGDLIGAKYRITRMIGDGGMGAVYEARHEVLGVPVALKFLHGELAKRPGLASRFLQEARVAAHIQSPHVARVTDVDTAADGSPYLVMELLSGESLQTLLDRETRLALQKAIDFALQILAGLEAAHAMNVVHRDLKPDNVFVTPGAGGPLLKLIDFGIAKLRATTEFQRGLTRAGVIMGTPEYMAPEQLFAADQVDLRADIYSMGVILFEMISGQRPSDGDDADQIIAKVMAGKVKKLAELVPDLPPGLASVIERATAPDREARLSNAFEFRQALAAFGVELSHAGRLAATLAQIAPMLTLASGSPPSEDFLPLSYARTSSAPPLSGALSADVARTLPPDATEPRGPYDTAALKGSTQRVSDDALQAARQSAGNMAVPSPAAHYPSVSPPQARKQSGLGWLFALVLGALVTGAAIVAVLLYERSRMPEEPSRTLETMPAATSLAPLAGPAPTGELAPSAVADHDRSSRPAPQTAGPRPKPDAGTVAQDAGTKPATSIVVLPIPIPLPSGFQIPSGLPTALPTVFPSAFPTTFPPLPGFAPPARTPESSPDGGN
jgi:serine/threonine protein kinase